MATKIEITTKPDGQITEYTISYEYGDAQAKLKVVNIDTPLSSSEDLTHTDLTELINALNKVRTEMVNA